jgi:hypothetical protein
MLYGEVYIQGSVRTVFSRNLWGGIEILVRISEVSSISIPVNSKVKIGWTCSFSREANVYRLLAQIADFWTVKTRSLSDGYHRFNYATSNFWVASLNLRNYQYMSFIFLETDLTFLRKKWIANIYNITHTVLNSTLKM